MADQSELKNCNPKAWRVIRGLRDAKAGEVEHEATLVKKRKEIKTDLAGAAANDRETLLRDLGEAVLFIEASRARIKSLEDKIDSAIDDAEDPKLWEDEPEVPKAVRTEGQLFAWLKAEHKQREQAKEREKAEGKTAEDDPGADGVDEHLSASIGELDLEVRVVSLLTDAGFKNIRQLVKVLDADDGDLTQYKGVGEATAEAVAKAVKKFRTKHRRAMREAEAPAGV